MGNATKTKRIEHINMLRPNPGLDKDGFNYFRFVCRGCTTMHRENTWLGFINSIRCYRDIDNSYLGLVEEPGNPYDANAVMVVCKGEFFGTVGYVGKEYTLAVKEILNKCGSYRVDMLNEDEVGEKEVSLVMTWEEKEQTEKRKEKLKVSEEERLRRKALGLPVTKPLRFMARKQGRFVEKAVLEYEVIATYPSEAATLLVTLEAGEQIHILSWYFAEMQKPSFVEDMEKGDFEEE